MTLEAHFRGRCARPWTGRRSLLAVSLSALGYWAVPAHAQIAVHDQGYIPFSDAPINYRSRDLKDPVAKLQERLDQGKARLVYDPVRGYLPSVLKLLNVPADSQTLVFSKTSFQYPKISPEHPRALYFNDDVYVGSVHQGKAVEIVSFDPMQGAIFYLLDERKAARPTFQRAELDCTQCHIAAGTRGIPGVLLQSVYPSADGTQVAGTRTYITDQQSPLGERWGGWYVTGYRGGETNMGNAVIEAPSAAGSADADDAAPKLTPFPKPFDSSSYLYRGSDVVALLVLAHQTQMHNLITLTNYKTRLTLYAQGGGAGSSGTAGSAADAQLPESIRRPAEQLLRYLLFSGEAPLGPGTQSIADSSAFVREFEARGPRDSQGRSLRDFDLRTRLFRYPCSYLIYSADFDAIPEPAKGYIYHRLLEILTSRDSSPDFAGLSPADRRSILEILLETKPGLPAEWREYTASNEPVTRGTRP